MRLVGSGGQVRRDPLYDATVALSGSAQLVLPVHQSRSVLILQNLSSHSMAVEIGTARAHATLTSGVVSSVTVDNAGFGFTKPPVIEFLGGGNAGNSSYLGLGQPGGASPNSSLNAGRPARAHAVLTTGAVSSIVVDDGGAGYVHAPFVFLYNSDLDPYGAAIPALGTAGFLLAAGSAAVVFNGTACPTDSVSVIGTAADVLMCKWME